MQAAGVIDGGAGADGIIPHLENIKWANCNRHALYGERIYDELLFPARGVVVVALNCNENV